MAITLKAAANIARLTSIGLFIVSLMLPCFDTDTEAKGGFQGALLLFTGFLGWFSYATGLIWLANPFLLISWIYSLKKPIYSFLTSIISVCIGFAFMLCKEIVANEGGTGMVPITGYRSGYWVWLASMLIMLGWNAYLNIRHPKLATLNPPLPKWPVDRKLYIK